MVVESLAIYVDNTARSSLNTGIQRCVRAITQALYQQGIHLVPVVWDRQRQDFGRATANQLVHLSCFSGPPVEAWNGQRGVRWLLILELVRGSMNPRAEQIRHAADQRGWAVAWLVHDTLPLRWDPDPIRRDHQRYLQGLGLFELVLANSQATARDLLRCWQQWRMQPPPLKLLRLAEQAPQAAPGLLQVQREPPVVLCVSTLEPRKNHRNLLKAVAWLHAMEMFPAQLVLVGWAQHPACVALIKRARSLGLPLRWLQNIDDVQLTGLYSQALICVYPSLEEGFGLPVVEALQLGKPCICSNSGAVGELAAAGGCWPVNPSEWPNLATALQQLLSQPNLRERLQHEALARPSRPWSAVVAELLKLLES